jgi:diguanylate cyclase
MLARIIGRCFLAAILGLLPLHSNASTAVEALLQKADAIRSSDPRTFQQLLAQLNKQKNEADSSQQERLAYLNAYALAYTGRFDAAITDARRLAESTSNVDLQYRAGALIINSYAATRQFTEGLRQLEQTLSLVDNIKDPELRQEGLAVAALFYNQVGQYQLGRYYAEQIVASPATPRAQCYAGALRLEALLHLKALPADDAPIVDAIEQCLQQQEAIWANFNRGTLARKWAAQGQQKRAIALLQAHASEMQATRYPRLTAEIESLLAELLLAEGIVDEAERHAKTAVAQSAGIVNSLPLVMAYGTLYEIAKRRGDTAAALENYRAYAEADKAYLNDVKTRELAYQIVHQENLQKNQQIEILHRQNQVLQLEQRVSRQSTQNTQLVVALLVVLLASIGYWAYKTKRTQMSFRRLAETDALTGISNRDHFTRRAEEALAYCARNGEDVGLILFDLDHFKTVNDRYGHVVGDHVLKLVAQECKIRCRKNDHFGRLGGEEFAILLIGCDVAAAERMAQVCRTHIAEIDTSQSGHCFQVTASFGVTSACQSGYDLIRILSHADQALYGSKHEGRDRVRAFRPETEPVRDRAPDAQPA